MHLQGHSEWCIKQHYLTVNKDVKSSPCTWGCFSQNLNRSFIIGVFPMYVGVFPTDEIIGLNPNQ